jgi:pimeloyl-ACP methyl ester carboxylesterase
MTITWLQQSRVRLALHTLRAGDGRALLLLHGLGERTPTKVAPELAAWPGPIYGLDFTGHGASTLPRGGGYTAELLMGDADAALAHLGTATIVGRGLGAYVALLIAGGRPTLVRGAVLRDGPGLAGGGSGSTSALIPHVDTRHAGPPDPYALVELALDVRPPDYATVFARQAAELSGLEHPLLVAARERPDWLRAVVNEVGVEQSSVAHALELCRGTG